MIIHLDMDDTLLDFRKAYNAARAKNPEQPYPQSQYGFFTHLELLPLAGYAVGYFVKRGHQVYFLSSPSVHNPLSYMEKRVSIEKLFGFDWCDKLILSCDKSLVKGDMLIDDRADSNKQNEFDGKLILFGSPEFRTWLDVILWFEMAYHTNESDALHTIIAEFWENKGAPHYDMHSFNHMTRHTAMHCTALTGSPEWEVGDASSKKQ